MLCFENILKTLGSPNNARETVLFLLRDFGSKRRGPGEPILNGVPFGHAQRPPATRPPPGSAFSRNMRVSSPVLTSGTRRARRNQTLGAQRPQGRGGWQALGGQRDSGSPGAERRWPCRAG